MIYDQWQQDVLAAEGNLAIRSGRQTGKSTVISKLASDYAKNNPKKLVMVIASTERQAYLLFEKILDYMFINYKEYLKKGKQYQTKTKLELKNGTKIYCLPTGLDGRGIRGFTVDLLIADEAAFIPRAVYNALTPSIATRIKTGARITSLTASQIKHLLHFIYLLRSVQGKIKIFWRLKKNVCLKCPTPKST